MSFLETVAKARDHLEALGRVSLRGLRREFDLDGEALEELIDELVDVQGVAQREDSVLIWSGARLPTQAAAASPPAVRCISHPT